MQDTYWNNKYRQSQRVWGEQPSELALLSVDYLREHQSPLKVLNILDLGCGYGRDTVYLAESINCRVTGIDISIEAIRIARESPPGKNLENIKYKCIDLNQLDDGTFDVLLISNLYFLLRRAERKQIKDIIKTCLNPRGFIFLNALSINDPEQYGKGELVKGEANSYVDNAYMHFFTGEELERDFCYLNIIRLFEREYKETQLSGIIHHHVSWMMVAEHSISPAT